MKEQLQFPGKITLRTLEKGTAPEPISGEFCPLPQSKGGGLVKGGAVTSAFMSAFL